MPDSRFDPNEPRDQHGQWSGTGGGAAAKLASQIQGKASGGGTKNDSVTATLDRLAAQTPAAARLLKGVSRSRAVWTKHNAQTAHGFYSPIRQQIVLNPEMSPADFTASAQKGVGSGWYTPTDPEHLSTRTVTHEYGHHLDSKLSNSERGHIFGIIAKSLGVSTAPDGSKKDIEAWVAANQPRIRTAVGRYAGKNSQELVAELLQEYFNTKNPRPLAKAVGDFVTNSPRIKGRDGSSTGSAGTHAAKLAG